MKTAYITAAHPQDVAREVEKHAAQGCRSFVLRPIAGGGMSEHQLDQERLGAARYAAGLQAEVVLESGVPAAAR
jgi:L-alanine-DL-glutamate epimerase-like enolase superfamily enzyme